VWDECVRVMLVTCADRTNTAFFYVCVYIVRPPVRLVRMSMCVSMCMSRCKSMCKSVCDAGDVRTSDAYDKGHTHTHTGLGYA
jgi:hypothetical protein